MFLMKSFIRFIFKHNKTITWIIRHLMLIGVYLETKSVMTTFLILGLFLDNYFLEKKFTFLEMMVKDLIKILSDIPFPKINSKN